MPSGEEASSWGKLTRLYRVAQWLVDADEYTAADLAEEDAVTCRSARYFIQVEVSEPEMRAVKKAVERWCETHPYYQPNRPEFTFETFARLMSESTKGES